MLRTNGSAQISAFGVFVEGTWTPQAVLVAPLSARRSQGRGKVVQRDPAEVAIELARQGRPAEEVLTAREAKRILGVERTDQPFPGMDRVFEPLELAEVRYVVNAELKRALPKDLDAIAELVKGQQAGRRAQVSERLDPVFVDALVLRTRAPQSSRNGVALPTDDDSIRLRVGHGLTLAGQDLGKRHHSLVLKPDWSTARRQGGLEIVEAVVRAETAAVTSTIVIPFMRPLSPARISGID